MTIHKRKKTYSYSSREQAEARAREARAHGHKTRVYYDKSTGRWIVEILFLAVALSFIGALFGRR